MLVEILAYGVLEHSDIDDDIVAPFSDSDGVAKIANRRRRETPAPESGQRRHAGIIPASHRTIVHQQKQSAFAQHGIAEVQTSEFDLQGP